MYHGANISSGRVIPMNKKYLLGTIAVAVAITIAFTGPANAEEPALFDIMLGIFTNIEQLSADVGELKASVHEIKESLPTINVFNQGIVGSINDEGKSVMTLECDRDAVVEMFHMHSHGKDAFQRMEIQYWTGAETVTKTVYTDQSVVLDIPVLRDSVHTSTVFTVEPYIVSGGHGDSDSHPATADTVRFHPIVFYTTNGEGSCSMTGDVECYTDHAAPGGSVSTCPDSEYYDPVLAEASN